MHVESAMSLRMQRNSTMPATQLNREYAARRVCAQRNSTVRATQRDDCRVAQLELAPNATQLCSQRNSATIDMRVRTPNATSTWSRCEQAQHHEVQTLLLKHDAMGTSLALRSRQSCEHVRAQRDAHVASP
jgi:hypothetical protein